MRKEKAMPSPAENLAFVESRKIKVDTRTLTDQQYRAIFELGMLVMSACMDLPLKAFPPQLKRPIRKRRKKLAK